MIEISEVHLTEIEDLMKDLKEMPYGIERRGKTLPPSAHHYANNFNRLVDILSLYVTDESNPAFQSIKSIQDNEIRKLKIYTDKSFEIYGVDQRMEELNSMIFMHVRSFLRMFKNV